MKHEALATATQALALTSQLLAIGIEIGIVAGGFYIYRKMTEEKKPDAVLVPEGMQLVQVKPEKKTWKEKWTKIRKIAKAVMEG